MNHDAAKAYCESIGATLPSRDDFVRLRKYMGATTEDSNYEGTGYTPQVLPNLTRQQDGLAVSNYFWSSSVHPAWSNGAYSFVGRYGGFDYFNRNNLDLAVRCVRR